MVGYTDLWYTAGSTTSNTITVWPSYDTADDEPFVALPPKPKTNVDWLRGRVDEMRVKLC